jgi:iron complex transport system ATP-binding protein
MRPDTPAWEAAASGFESTTGLWQRPDAGVKRAALKALGALGVRGLKDQGFGSLSSGEQLKVILARALIRRPEVLILDEPFSLLDMASRWDLYRRIEKLADTVSIVMVTHHLEDIRPIFTHALLLKRGRVHAHGALRRVLNAASLRKFFGSLLDDFSAPKLK